MSETTDISNNNWRSKPLARAIVLSSCAFMLVSTSAPLYAAPPTLALPTGGVVTHGSASINTVGNAMTVNQGSSKAVLNWSSFNIGKDASVQFNQPSAQSVALNKIGGNSASEIFGHLGANGSVYLINNNGILFGTGSQVNVHGLVASTLNMDADRFMKGSLAASINDGQAVFDGTAANASVVVQTGATIKTDSGGQVLMFAPNVVNNGNIATPDGQTILAASKDKVYLATSNNDNDLRGLLVEVATGGNVTNVGTIVAERGNVTLLGLAVNQNGRVRATTSVDVNGSIRLLARDKAVVLEPDYSSQQFALMLDDSDELPNANTRVAIASHTGTVKFGANSSTEVVADTQLGADQKVRTAPDAQTQNRSRIDAMGQTIVVGDNATLRAKSGRINLTATTDPLVDPNSTGARNASRIYVGKNATLDVSGENVELAMSRRLVDVELRGDELKDSPLQRNGVLRGKTVKVDIATGSPLIADLQPTLTKVRKDVRERMVEGGTINLRSQGDVVLSDKANLNMSGGSITYAAGFINTTKLMTEDGRLVDIGNADPNRRYAGIFGEHTEMHPKWGKTTVGQTSSTTVGTYRDSFTEGKNAGALNIVTQALHGFDRASLQAGVQRGATQRSLGNGPVGGTIDIRIMQDAAGAQQNVVLDQAAHSAALGVNDAASGAAYISAAALDASGAGKFSLKANGRIDVTKNAAVRLNAGSTFALTGTSINFNGSVRAPSGTVSLTTAAPVLNTGNDAQPLTVAAGSRIDVSGSWINDLLDIGQSPVLAPLALRGGSIALSARGNLNVAQGASLLANGGAQLTAAGAFKGGDGGSIKIVTNAVSITDAGSLLKLNGQVSAYGYAQGGKLALEANGFKIGGGRSSDARIVPIDPLFFTQGGFSDFTLTANLIGLEVAPNSRLAPVQTNRRVSDLEALKRIASGSDISSLTQQTTLADYQRNPTNLHLNAVQTVNRGSTFSPAYLRIGDGAQINADNGARIDLSTTGSLFVNGSLQAHGGAINLGVVATPEDTVLQRGYVAGQSLWLGSRAKLDASAGIERANDPRGQLLDAVFDAGSVKLTAGRGFIVAAPGSAIDVSAPQPYQIALPRTLASASRTRTATLNPAAGSIEFNAADGIAAFATLRGEHTGTALAGSVAYMLDGNSRKEGGGADFEFFPLEIQLAQSQSWSNLQFGSALPTGLRGKALVAADTIARGGFGSLDLSVRNKKDLNQNFGNPGSIVFGSDVTLNLSDALTLGATNIDAAGHSVALRAAAVTLGSDFWEDGGASQIKQDAGAGAGRLSLAGQTIDVVGNVGISGADATNLKSAGDLRLRSVVNGVTGRSLAAAELTTPGDLNLQAAQIYPGTLSDYTIRLSGADSVLRTRAAGARTPLFSAAGKLTLQAPVIEHAGVLAAPLGTVVLNASQSIHLAKGSVVDVSAHNLLIPFGRLRGGELNWIYPLNADAPLVISAPPQKAVLLTAPSVKMDAGATVDLSGGGDIYAFEQIPGPGGSRDFLDAANAKGAFAVIPSLGGLTAPYDNVEMSGTGIKLGSTVWLDGSNGLPAGNYAVLPAHYALLPGAYLITPQGSSSPIARANTRLIDGTTVVSGRFGRGLSGQYATQWQSFSVETGAAARLRSEYKELTGDKFFADAKVDLAADAGRMAVAAQTDLTLEGTINAAAQNGRGAQLDIIADQIAVVADAAQEVGEGAVKLVASSLNKLGVDSLMLGGQRSRNGDDTNVNVLSNSVRIEDGATLQAPDIILAARDTIEVGANASVSGRGASKVNTRAFVVDGDGALLRATSAEQSNVQRSNSSGASGNLRIDATATLAADKALLLDASGEMALPGTLAVNNGSLNISANRISLGAVPAGTSGVALSSAQLNALQTQTLRLSSRSSLDFFDDVAFSNHHTELNSGLLRNLAAGDVQIAADTLQLENGTNALAAVGVASGGGTLVLDAKNIVLGRSGDAASTMQLQGFDSVQLGSQGKTRSVRGAGDFTLVSNSLTLYADSIAADSAGANTQLVVDGSVVLNKANAPAAITPVAAALGARLSIEGNSIVQGTRIELLSGTVSLNATGSAASDHVVLLAGSEIDVSGRSIATPHSSMNTSAGQVKLTSASADVVANAGSSIHLSGAEKGGDAGALIVNAIHGQALLNGALVATKTNDARGANLSVDAGSLGNINALLALANSAGVDNSLALRARSGDMAITANARASSIDISTDTGKLSLNSTLDAGGANGGRVALYAGDDLELQSGANIKARATADSGRGGHVELGSSAGALKLAGVIDVSGGGEGGRDGQVHLRVARSTDNSSIPVTNNGIAISGAERVQLAAFKTYQNSELDAGLLEQARLDAVAFMQNEDAIKAGLGSLVTAKFHLVPEIEVQSSTDLAVTAPVDFAADNDGDYRPDNTWRFGSLLEAPVLTLRAAGNLDIAESLSDGVYGYSDPHSRLVRFAGTKGRNVKLLMAGDATSYRLIGGADLGAANPDATGSSGNLTISNGADVVTGAGSVTLAAGGNLVVGSADSLIASLGNTSYSDYESPYGNSAAIPAELGNHYAVETLPDTGTFNAVWAYLLGYTLPQYPHQGGDVRLNAGGDISFATPSRFFSSWLERVAGPFTLRALAETRAFDLTTWGVMPDFLKEGLVALGGGNIDINAGASIQNLNAALPSTGKQIGVGADVVEITRSGSLSVHAGQNILSPRVLVDNGQAELRAGGDIGAVDGGLQAVAVLGDASLLLRANGDIGVDAVFNTTVMPQSKNQTQGFFRAENYFFTYGNDTAVTLESVQGDVTLNNDIEAVYTAFNGDFPSHANDTGTGNGGFGSFGTTPNIEGLAEKQIFGLYPAQLNVVAASGDIRLQHDLYLFPAARGQLNLLAGGDILAAPSVRVRQSDADPAALPSLYNPVRLLAIPDASADSPLMRLFGDSALAHADTPVHLHDNEASVIDALGDIVSGDKALYQLAEATWIAARDIVSTSFSIQNNRSSDVSEIVAQRDILYPLVLLDSGALQTDNGKITISGPGRLDVFAGRNIDLGTSDGFVSNGNADNPHLPDSGADLNVFAGINGPTAFSDPVLFNTFVDSYLSNVGGPAGSYIGWFGAGNFSGDAVTLLTVFTGKSYANRDAAMADFATLPTLTRQAISLEAWRNQRNQQLAQAANKTAYSQLDGSVDANDYSADLIDYVSFDRFGGDLRSAVSAVTHTLYATNEAAATALAALTSAQQHQIAKSALTAASTTARRELLSDIFLNEIRQGGVENENNLIAVAGRDGFDRSYAAIERMFPGKAWKGDISLVFSALRTQRDGDINFFTPGGSVDVGLAGQFAGVKKTPEELGIITQRYGAINGFADGDISINQSRISSLDGAGIALWSTHGNIDAGRGAKSALTIPPPKVNIDPVDGSVTLVFDAAVSGSGIQSARNNRKTAADRGPLTTDSNSVVIFGSDSRTDRDRYERSLSPGSNYLFAPNGVVDAGDAGISVDGNLLVAAQSVVGADNISVGGISIGVPSSTAISAGTLSLGDVASSATDSATSSMNDAIKEAAAALAESTAAFVTVDIIGVGN